MDSILTNPPQKESKATSAKTAKILYMREKIEQLIAEHKLHRDEVLEELNKSVPGDVRLLEEYSMRTLFIQQLEELL